MQLRPLKQNGALYPGRKQPALQSKGNRKEKPRSVSEGRGYRIQRDQILSSMGQGCCAARKDGTPHAAPTCPVPADTGEQHNRESVPVVRFHHPVLMVKRQTAAQTL